MRVLQELYNCSKSISVGGEENMSTKKEFWTSQWGLILAGIGMAVGCGNIWRFPRIAAKYGGSTFIIAWIIALFVWSIPILVLEISMGRSTRKGPIGAFQNLLAKDIPGWEAGSHLLPLR